jgi:hypothetical protein
VGCLIGDPNGNATLPVEQFFDLHRQSPHRQRLYALIQTIQAGGRPREQPVSRAASIENNWFREQPVSRTTRGKKVLAGDGRRGALSLRVTPGAGRAGQSDKSSNWTTGPVQLDRTDSPNLGSRHSPGVRIETACGHPSISE